MFLLFWNILEDIFELKRCYGKAELTLNYFATQRIEEIEERVSVFLGVAIPLSPLVRLCRHLLPTCDANVSLHHEKVPQTDAGQ